MSSTRRRSSGHHKAAHGTFVIEDDDDDDEQQHHPVGDDDDDDDDDDNDETTHERMHVVTSRDEVTWGPGTGTTSTSTTTTTARYTKLTTPPSSTVELTTQARASSPTRQLIVDEDEEDTADFWNTANNNDDTPAVPPPEWLSRSLLLCGPCFRPLFDDSSPPEATGLALDLWARGYILMSSLFVGPALLDLAHGAATWSGGTCDHNDDDDADNDFNDCRVYGFKPTSLLANIAIGAGLLGSLTMPLVGAVIDHTPYRRGAAAVSAVVLGMVKAVEACIGPQTWFLVANLQVLSSLLYNTHATAAYAYTSELTTTTTTTTTTMDSNKKSATATNHATTTNNNPQQSTRQAQYNAHFNIILYVSMLLFLILVLFLAAWLVPLLVVEEEEEDKDDEENSNDQHTQDDRSFTSLGQLSSEAQANVYTARISQTVTGIVTIPCFIFAWKYFFGPRPAAPLSIPTSLLLVDDNDEESTTTILSINQEQQHALNEQPNHHSYSLWTIGFVKVAHTARSILRHNRPLAGALLSILLAEAAMSALATIATTYATHVLGMAGSEIGLLFFIVLVTGIPGSHYGGNLWTVRWSPQLSVVAAHASFVVITTISVFLLNGPGDKNQCYLFGALWGFVIGWLSPADTSLFMSFLSSKNESSRAEWMGMFLLATSALSWLPPLVFTLLNEAGWHMKWGLASLNLYFVGAAVCLLLTRKT